MNSLENDLASSGLDICSTLCLVVCRKCKYALANPSIWRSHPAKIHHLPSLSDQTIKDTVEALSLLPKLECYEFYRSVAGGSKRDLQSGVLPPAIPGLLIMPDGHQCLSCNWYFTCNVAAMKGHFTQKHKDLSPPKIGKD